MPRADPSLSNHSCFDVLVVHSSTKDHLAVNPDMLLCSFFQFSSLLLPAILAKQHVYLCFCCLLPT